MHKNQNKKLKKLNPMGEILMSQNKLPSRIQKKVKRLTQKITIHN